MTQKAIDGLKSDHDLWNSIEWKEVNQIVDCLQRRIVKAVKAKNKEKVRSLQRLLAGSLAGRLKAVRRVTTNRGKRTPGVDKILLDTPGKKWRQAHRALGPEDGCSERRMTLFHFSN